MTTLSSPRVPRKSTAPPDPCRVIAVQIIAAARSLSGDATISIDVRRCRAIAAALAEVLSNPDAGRDAILAASPYVIERCGRVKTLVEMIEAEEGDEQTRLRLCRLLLRALDWR